eukprot:763345-Hanusia_phi.AAC.3
MFSCFYCRRLTGETDRQTDRQADRHHRHRHAGKRVKPFPAMRQPPTHHLSSCFSSTRDAHKFRHEQDEKHS